MKALKSKRAAEALRSGEPIYVVVVPRPMRREHMNPPKNLWRDAIWGAVLGFLSGCLVAMIGLQII